MLRRLAKVIFSKRAFYEAVPYMPLVWDAVKIAHEVTRNKDVESVIELSEKLGVPELWGDRTIDEVIRAMVVRSVKMKYPDIPDSLLNRAVELAYGEIKSGL